MKVVIAPDKFKGSLTAAQVAEHIARPFRAAKMNVLTVPMADGGEGTLDAAISAGFSRREAWVTGPLGTPVLGAYALDDRTGRAVIESAIVSGLRMTGGLDADARFATSRGTGELISLALDAGAREIVLGVGGVASTDGGAGMMSGLGAALYDSDSQQLGDGGIRLMDLARVDLRNVHSCIAETKFVLAADVSISLLGKEGSAQVFAYQKGAGPETVEKLDASLANWVRILEAGGHAAPGMASLPGAGAAGGLGYAALALLGAKCRAGVEVILELNNLASSLPGADLLITGEGSLDKQSLFGKVPIGVARVGVAHGVPTVAIAGRSTLSQRQIREAGFTRQYQLMDIEPDLEASIRNAGGLLEILANNLSNNLQDLICEKPANWQR